MPRIKIYRTCIRCQKVFRVPPSRIKEGQALYCSMSCRHDSDENRFLAKVEKTGTCWIYKGCKGKSGYGKMRAFKKSYFSAHRYSWILKNGKPIPNGMSVLHRCDNPACVNPDHLFLGTHRDNMDDKIAKGRVPKGSRHGRAKLTEKVVAKLKKEDAVSKLNRSLVAKKYGVSTATIQHALNGITWRHVVITGGQQ